MAMRLEWGEVGVWDMEYVVMSGVWIMEWMGWDFRVCMYGFVCMGFDLERMDR